MNSVERYDDNDATRRRRRQGNDALAAAAVPAKLQATRRRFSRVT